MLFTDDIILINETRDGFSNKLERQMEYQRQSIWNAKFDNPENETVKEVTIDGIAVLRVEKFRFLSSILQYKGNIDGDIVYYIIL